MSRRAATLSQTEIARAVRAAKQAGAAEVEVHIGGGMILIRLDPSTGPVEVLVDPKEIVL